MLRKSVVIACLALAALTVGIVMAGDETTTALDVKLSVRGMTCADCTGKVKAALVAVPGVTKAEVSLDKNEAMVTYEKGKTTPEVLVKAVEKAGFKCSLPKAGEKAAENS
jgi:periplasmic mercuric ion binding protein